MLVRGEVEGVEARLQDAERWLDGRPGDGRAAGMVVVGRGGVPACRRRSPSTGPGWPGSRRHGRHHRPRPTRAGPRRRGRSCRAWRRPPALLGLAYWTRGRSGGGAPVVCRRHGRACEQAGHVSDVIGCAIALADIRIAQGRLREALSSYERHCSWRPNSAAPALRGTADMHVGMSELLRERNDLDAAAAAPAGEPGTGRTRRAAAEPVSLASRDGADPRGAKGISTPPSSCSTRRSGCT